MSLFIQTSLSTIQELQELNKKGADKFPISKPEDSCDSIFCTCAYDSNLVKTRQLHIYLVEIAILTRLKQKSNGILATISMKGTCSVTLPLDKLFNLCQNCVFLPILKGPEIQFKRVTSLANQMYFRFQKDLMTGFDPLATRCMV